MFASVKQILAWSAERLADPRDPRVIAKAKREEIEALRTEIRRVATSPAPLDDAIANMRKAVDAISAAWRSSSKGLDVINAFSSRYTSRSADGAYRLVGPTMYRLDKPGNELTLEAMAGLMPDTLKAGLEDTMRAYRGEFGPSLDERTRMLTKMFGQLRTLREEYEALRTAAAAIDPLINLPMLSEAAVADDRFAKDADREREEQREAAQRKREAEQAESAARRGGAVNTTVGDYR